MRMMDRPYQDSEFAEGREGQFTSRPRRVVWHVDGGSLYALQVRLNQP